MKKVIILGGGVAGMSAAHELVERGYDVEVYERNPKYVGGKARSTDIADTNILNPELFLPGEHGFRFFPGFYKHVIDTMKRIPTSGGKTIFQNFVNTKSVQIAQAGESQYKLPVNFPSSISDIKKLIHSWHQSSNDLTHEEKEFFAYRVWQLMSSCNERFMDEYENIGWWEYCQADRFSDAYKRLLVEGLTRSLVAAKARNASTKTVGSIFLQLIYVMLNYNAGDTDRVLNSPTNEAWLNPWLEYLQAKGVKYYKGMICSGFNTSHGLITEALIQKEDETKVTPVSGDYYILAVPLEKASVLINESLLSIDPSLNNIVELAPNVEWMNGIQFFLNQEVNLNYGHTIYSNSKWALTSISQLQFWSNYNISSRFNGQVKTVLSVDVSSWNTEGNFNNKKAKDCSIEEIKQEVWEQLKLELNSSTVTVLKDEMREFVHIDNDIVSKYSIKDIKLFKDLLTPSEHDYLQKVIDTEPLLVNQVNTWNLRPNAFTAIPNFFLASDYVKTNTDLATMEGANEAARRAVNCILDDNAQKDFCKIWTLFTPKILTFVQRYDRSRYIKGLEWTPIIPVWMKVVTAIWTFFYVLRGLAKNLLFGKK